MFHLSKILLYKYLRPASGIVRNGLFDTCTKRKNLYRLLGGLLSAHLLLIDDQKHFGDISFNDYDNELLDMAHDLANRLLPAFENTHTGIPHPRVRLLY